MTPRPRGPRNRRKINPVKYSGDRILIVCEDGVSTPAYIRALCKAWRLSGVTVEGVGGAPSTVVERAKELRRKASKGSITQVPFDQVWCVFDRDTHPTFEAALNQARTLQYKTAVSYPCFELWLLLHCCYTSKPFQDCNAVIQELKKYLPDDKYEKGAVPHGYFLEVDRLNLAVENAERLARDAEKADMSTRTEMHLLIQAFRKLKPLGSA